MSAVLATAGVGKRYRSGWALRDCTISVPAGRVVALVGPNGAGKTTLLHLAVGLLRPDAGWIAVLDRPPRRRPDVLARVGFVAQDKPLYRGFTVADTMRLGAGLNPAWDQGFAARRVEHLGIDPGRRIGQLSGGQRAQVALTLALGKRPQLLLLDEPVAELDPLARQDFTAAVMAEVAAGELTVVFSSHAIAELEPVCDHLVLLGAARTQLAGDLDDLLAAHRLLVGPRRVVSGGERIAGHQIIAVSHAERQTSALVRLAAPGLVAVPGWSVREVDLAALVLAYMRHPDAAAPGRPALHAIGKESSWAG